MMNKVITIRQQQVIIDKDLAELCQVKTKVLNQTVKRHIERFSEIDRFQLNNEEMLELVTNCDRFKNLKHSTITPFAFTKIGVKIVEKILKKDIQIDNFFNETTEQSLIVQNDDLRSKIHLIRGSQVMLDFDLANLYQVETKNLNLAVKRNIERFPETFRFQLTNDEYSSLRLQIETSKRNRGGTRYLPFAFTEQGVSMLSAVLKSDAAIKTSIQIINTFVKMRKFILDNDNLNYRLSNLEQKQIGTDIKQLETDNKIDTILNIIEKRDITPKEGLFYDGQVFDAYAFVSDLIKQAKKSIILIDNYIDESVLTMFLKRNENCKLTIYTQQISEQLQLDLKKHNKQYDIVTVKIFKHAHDRFLILDNKEIYHFGASLKDLGNKIFAFSKFNKSALDILRRLK